MIAWNGMIMDATISANITFEIHPSYRTIKYASIAARIVTSTVAEAVMIREFLMALRKSICVNAATMYQKKGLSL